MGVFQARIWKNSFFKNINFLFSSNKRTLKVVFISETGIISLDNLALDVGYVYSEVSKSAWAVIQKLKLPMQGSDELVLPISERTYLPLDPLNRLQQEDKDAIEPLKNIARAKHAEVKSRIIDENKQSQNHKMLNTCIYIMGIVLVIAMIIYFIKK
jgi:hypothetical protein